MPRGETNVTATEVWKSLDAGWKASLEEAWQSWCDGSAGVGAAIVDGHGAVVSRDRNRRHDRWQSSALGGSRLAHAEMCVLASLPTGDFDDYTLYTTFEPCLMCASAIIMCGVPRVRYAAADPVFDGLHDWFRSLPYAAPRIPERTSLGGPIGAFAHVLHLSWIALWFPEGDSVELHGAVAPKHLAIASDLADSADLRSIAADRGSVTAAIDALWPDLVDLGRC
jgi:tRNA(Arg) A34 adenosine deaminase TadA